MKLLEQAFYDKMLAIGISDLNTLAMALTMGNIESGNYPDQIPTENLNYSAEALMAQWPRHFDSTNAYDYARKPEKIANRAYAGRMGNGDENSGDGWKYRGRGIIQTTGKYLYGLCGNALKLDLVNNPDWLLVEENAINTCVWFLFTYKQYFELFAKKGDVKNCTIQVNGGVILLPERVAKYAYYLKLLKSERN